MTKAPLPENETARLEALREYDVLDTDPEQGFDNLTFLAAHICGAPIALISLVDAGRQWFKSSVGLTATETSRDVAFCAHAILQPGLFIVQDALADERFSQNPLVTSDPHIRFYAGAPLVTPEGHSVGTLCVIDRVPRQLTAEQEAALKALSHHVITQLELRRHVAALRRATREAEAANRAKDVFLAMISHELRTPLTAITGWVELLLSDALDPATARRGLEAVAHAAQVQAQLIEDLLDVSRIIAGKLRLTLEPIELAPVIGEAVEAARPTADAQGVSLSVDTGGAVGLVSGDPARLQQVVSNLLSNAIKFTPVGGEVSVRLERAGADAQVVVTDTGRGIEADFLPHIFDRFRQAESTNTRTQGGLGLGLAIVRHLVELHGGAVRAESEGEGRGSVFMVKIPLLAVSARGDDEEGAARAFAGAGAPAASLPSLAGLRLLVVDDEANTRELLHTLFEQCGAAVTASASAAEAIKALESSPPDVLPDVLIADLEMPVEDGYSLIRRVRALPPGRGGAAPAVALTAHAAPEDQQRALAAGFQVHIAKPFQMNELVSRVADLAAQGRRAKVQTPS